MTILLTPSPLHVGKDEGACTAHAGGIAIHHLEIDLDERRQILLVDDEKVGFSNAGAALARDFLALAYRDHVDGDIGEIGRKGCRQIVAAGFDENDIKIRKPLVQAGNGLQIDRRIFTDGRVRAAARFDADNAIRRQRLHAHQRFRIFGRVDVIGDDGDGIVLAHRLAQLLRQRRLAGTDRATDPNAQGSMSRFHARNSDKVIA